VRGEFGLSYQHARPVSQIIVETLERLDMKFPKPAFGLGKIHLD